MLTSDRKPEYVHFRRKLTFLLHENCFCSHKDTRWVSDVFMRHKKPRSRRFDLEKEHGFRLVIHRRDWIAGRTIRANIMDSIEKSRRVIFIISRYRLTKVKTPRVLLYNPSVATKRVVVHPGRPVLPITTAHN